MKTKEDILNKCIEKNNLDAFNAVGTFEAVLVATDEYADQKTKSIKFCKVDNIKCGHLQANNYCNRIGFCEFKLPR